jgi:hypothetical protein
MEAPRFLYEGANLRASPNRSESYRIDHADRKLDGPTRSPARGPADAIPHHET